MKTWSTPCGQMMLPDDMPLGAFKDGHINWASPKSALINAYIQYSYFHYANTPGPAEDRNKAWQPEQYRKWVASLHPKLRFWLSRTQSDMEKLQHGAVLWDSYRENIGRL